MSDLVIPKHVAIVMDGNGRWAKNLGKPRTFGHVEGIKALERIVKYSQKIKIKHLTLYAFSTENWNRPKLEVDFLMTMFKSKLKSLIYDSDLRFRYKLLGSRENISKNILELSDMLEEKTKSNEDLYLNIAFNYGSRKEIIDASKKIAEEYKFGKIDDINEDTFNDYLYTSGQPDVDLLIRTGKEKRLSNFLLWQSSYAELIFTDVFWPDFSESELDKCIKEFNERERKFGRI